jgi:Mn2+/Fe2+ NRAMP family transporter
MGPGLIVMAADNDAGALATYTEAGAKYGLYHLLWLLLLLLPITYIVQSLVVRLGICTGQGHAAMIYKKFGKWWGTFSLCDLLIVNGLTLVTEFAMVSLIMTQLGVSPYWSVPLVALGLSALVLTTKYTIWERSMIVLCLLDIIWFVIALSHRNCTHMPIISGIHVNGSFIFMLIAIVGTTIAPWQLFFQQSCICDKRLRFKDIKLELLDTFVGAVFTIVIAGCMMWLGRAVGAEYKDPAQMAVLLGARWGHSIGSVLLLLCCNAAILGIVTVSLASSWAYGEVRGWPHSLQLGFKEAKGFYGVYIICVMGAAGIVLIPHLPLQLVIVSVQVLAGMVLPSTIIFLQLLLSDKQIMGEHVNTRWANWVNWTIIGLLVGLSAVLVLQTLLGQIHL